MDDKTRALARQTTNLAAAARRVADTAGRDGWRPSDALAVLRAIDHLTAALGRLGPPAVAALAPAAQAVEAMRHLVRTSPRPGDRPEDWIGRDERVAEALFIARLNRPGGRACGTSYGAAPDAGHETDEAPGAAP
ncbi:MULTISPECIES: hypothetical protein [unclassified Streptomyces]|uniref:hypothetical protein n=1 Tax=unclassified Streptomyces TaxID=2593676 RepID=UPI0035E18CA8